MVSIGHVTQTVANVLVEEIKRVSGASSLGLFSSLAKCFCLSDEDSDSYSPRYSYSEDSK